MKTSDLNFYIEEGRPSEIVYGASAEYIIKNNIREMDWDNVINAIIKCVNLGNFRKEYFKKYRIKKDIDNLKINTDTFLSLFSSKQNITELDVVCKLADWVVRSNENSARINYCEKNGKRRSMRKLLVNIGGIVENYTKTGSGFTDNIIDCALNGNNKFRKNNIQLNKKKFKIR